jgi:hypothetical protein
VGAGAGAGAGEGAGLGTADGEVGVVDDDPYPPQAANVTHASARITRRESAFGPGNRLRSAPAVAKQLMVTIPFVFGSR